MIYVTEDGRPGIQGEITCASEIITFLWWEIEKQTFPNRKITVRLKWNKQNTIER